jgi:hypothetical protein
MDPYRQQISVIEPIGLAFNCVKAILFRPFDIERWFAIGFCAWLASLGSGSGSGGGSGGRIEKNVQSLNDLNRSDIEAYLYNVKEFIIEHLIWIVPLSITVIALSLGIWLLLLWLSSRGRFMFLHCVTTNIAEVKAPWYGYKVCAHSLLLFRVTFSLVSTLLFAGYVALNLLLIWPQLNGPPLNILWTILMLLPLALVLACASGVISTFTNDFVTPIMRLRSQSCVAAWREFLKLFSSHLGTFFLYLFFKTILNIAIMSILVIAGLVTCGCACCFMSIPFIGTVLLLPVSVFKRSYSLLYLRQFGSAYDSFAVNTSTASEPQISS